jgi:hypothetical protein
MAEAPNPEGVARTPTGEIVDQGLGLETTKDEVAGTDTKGEEKSEGTSLVNGGDKEEKPSEPAVPEAYEFKVPEGFELDETVSKEATELFKSMKLGAEPAQKLVDFYVKNLQSVAEAPLRMVQEQNDKWVSEVKADAEIGGKLDQVRTTISKAIDGLGDPVLSKGFRQVIDFTGAGNNLSFIKGLYKLAQQVTEGSHVRGNGPSAESQKAPGAAPTSAARALYPNLA